MTETPAVSTPEDFAEETVSFTLPRPGASGNPLVVMLRYLTPPRVLQCFDEVPGLDDAAEREAGRRSFEQVRNEALKADAVARRMVEQGVVAPRFHVGAGEPPAGQASWDAVHPDNQAAIVTKLFEMSPFGSPKTAAAAQEVAPLATSFPADGGGAS